MSENLNISLGISDVRSIEILKSYHDLFLEGDFEVFLRAIVSDDRLNVLEKLWLAYHSGAKTVQCSMPNIGISVLSCSDVSDIIKKCLKTTDKVNDNDRKTDRKPKRTASSTTGNGKPE